MMSKLTFEYIANSLLIGLLSSIISVTVIWFINQFWKKIFEPWFEEKLYKGPEISGKWSAHLSYESGNENDITYIISRSGTRVKGKAICSSGYSKGMIWKFDGSFEGLILSLSYSALERSKLDRGNITMMLVNNGLKLKGYINYYQDDIHSIKSVSIEMNKLNDDSKMD